MHHFFAFPMTSPLLFWHRRDLRMSDNVGLAKAAQRNSKTVGVFCLDPGILERDDVAPARVVFLLESLKELQESYRKIGGELFILHQAPVKGIPALAAALQVDAVYWNEDVEPYGRERDEAVQGALEDQGIEVQQFWDQLLHAPNTILTGSNQPYKVYSPFWKNWRSQPKETPYPAPSELTALTDAEQKLAQQNGAIALPSPKDMGVNWDNLMEIPV